MQKETEFEGRVKIAYQEIKRLHKQDGNGDAPRYFALSGEV